MEQNDIQTIKNLVISIKNGVVWELDKKLKETILNELDFRKFDKDGEWLMYNNKILMTLRDIVDEYSWKNRKIDQELPTSKLAEFNYRLLLTVIRNNTIQLPDKVLIMAMASKIGSPQDNTRYSTSLSEEALNKLAPESKRLLPFVKEKQKESKSDKH